MKFIGAILIISASIYASFYYEKRLKAIIDNQLALIEFIEYISSQIEFFAKPINEIFNEYNTNNLLVLEILNKKELSNISCIDSKVQKDVYKFLCILGKGYKKEQLTICSYTKGQLISCTDALKMEYSKKCKVYRSLSLFIGVSAVILLI